MPTVSSPVHLAWLVALVLCASACRTPEASPTSPVAPAPAQSAASPASVPAPAPAPSASASANQQESAPPPITARKLTSEPQPGRYLLDAYVVELIPCPVCEPPLRCKPCVSERVALADEPHPPAGTAAWLRVTTDQLRSLVVAARYHFVIEVHPAIDGGSGINYAEVLQYDGPVE